MKNIKILIILYLSVFMAACDLDIVPDNVATLEDNAFSLRKEAEKVLFTCYRYMPKEGSINGNPAIIGSGDYVITDKFRYDNTINSWYILLGNQKAEEPYNQQWKDLYKGIAYCNILLENIYKTPDMEEYEKERWKSEAEFLKAYYHFYLVKMYGPITIVDKYIPVDTETQGVYLYRNTLDECFDYIINLLDKVIEEKKIPEKIDNQAEEMGRITIGIAMALKAKVKITAASPLFNGNTDYSGITDSKGIEIFNPNKTEQEKKQRWEDAAKACQEAIAYLESLGHGLYTFDPLLISGMLSSDCIMMNLRGAVTEKWNREIVWGNTQSWVGNDNQNDLQRQSLPRDLDPAKVTTNATTRNNLGVSMHMADAFYTKNGVPMDEDKTWDYDGRYNLKVVPSAGYDNMLIPGWKTANINFDREYRYYGSLGFDGNIWFGQGQTDNSKLYQVKVFKGHVLLKPNENAQNLTAIWPKKMVHYQTVTGATSGITAVKYPFPIIRMADLYLMYAEALNESGVSYATVLPWIDKVRERSGIKGVEESWTNYSKNPSKYKSPQGLREIIMKERRIELAFEGHYFWDIRRWKTAINEMRTNLVGWNTLQNQQIETFYQPKVYKSISFSPRDYFWPITLSELRKNPNLIQNYGW